MSRAPRVMCLLAALGLAGCEQLGALVGASEPPPPPPPPPPAGTFDREEKLGSGPEAVTARPPTATPEEERAQLLRGVVDRLEEQCIDRLAVRLRDSHSRYLLWVHPSTGRPRDPNLVHGLYETNHSPSECLEALRSIAPTLPEDTELIEAADRFAPAVVALVPYNNAAAAYYEGNHVNDDFAEGVERHPRLMQAFDFFAEADDAFREVLEQRDEALDQRALARLEPSTRPADLVERNALLAERLVEVADRLELDVTRRLVGLEPELLAEAVEALEEALRLLRANPPSGLDSFLGRGTELTERGRRLHQRLVSGRPYSAFQADNFGGPGGWMTEDSPGGLRHSYDWMTQARDHWETFR